MMENKSTPVWDILLSKANASRQSKQQALDKVNQIKQQALGRQTKVDTLLQEYQERMTSMQEDAHSNTEAETHRNFIFQLMDIQNRTTVELAQIDADVAGARQALLETEQECLKVDYLAKRHREQQLHTQLAQEAKEADMQGMMQFNLKSMP